MEAYGLWAQADLALLDRPQVIPFVSGKENDKVVTEVERDRGYM